MTLQVIDQDFTVCRLPEGSQVDLSLPFVFVGTTAIVSFFCWML